ncbi:unnamed protein product [Strongylus vulgaris]|uniref:Uncharacterized protein n=1 Tax=Strongylus vulgaris TaxID=40348 RepID=A0A3P7JJV6_STRVU|nr:unnamed protein product [Strongylus vulgaris]
MWKKWNAVKENENVDANVEDRRINSLMRNGTNEDDQGEAGAGVVRKNAMIARCEEVANTDNEKNVVNRFSY